MNKYSFTDILTKEVIIQEKTETQEEKKILFSKIEIPMIQRDYAQGRKVKNENAKNDEPKFVLNEQGKKFITNIFDALRDSKEMQLDFVYGSVSEFENKEKKKEFVFIPLDGQQRLTTLFLLHWYIANREKDESEKSKMTDDLKNALKKFTYSTRTSSRNFCEMLCETKIEFVKTQSTEIENLSWFFKSYKKDPTIKAMLNMLDAIHQRYEKIENKAIFDNLQKLQFYILPLDGFNLTEDLYIKMNARGKQLTDFENFKADLTKWMKDEKNLDKTSFNKEVEYQTRKMPFYLSISQKMDNEWTDYFWSITKNYDINAKDKNGNLIYPNGKLVDPLFMRFFNRYMLNAYILRSKNDSKIIEKENDFISFAKENKYSNFDLFNNLINYEIISKIENIFDKLHQNKEIISKSISPCWFTNKHFSFLDARNAQSEIVIFYGITNYLEKFDFDETKFKQWMRVVWNIVENRDVDNWASAIGVLKLISELSENANDIYNHLDKLNYSNLTQKSSTYAVKEEIWKSKFIMNDLNFENMFIAAEKHSFFRGCVSFIMTDEMNIDDFKHRTTMAESVFSDKNGVNSKFQEKGHLFLRAIISKYDKSEHIIKKNFTDTEDDEHYLKKMLASDEIVRNATREWFSLSDEKALEIELGNCVAKDSTITGWDTNNNFTQIRTKKVHESLYKSIDLQNWMQIKKAIRVGWVGDRIFVSCPRAWYDWVFIDGYRNEIINLMITKYGFAVIDNRQIKINNNIIPFFWGKDEIILKRKIIDIEFECIICNQFLRVGKKETQYFKQKFNSLIFEDAEKANGWICRKKYDYSTIQNEEGVNELVQQIETEVFGETNSLLSKLKSVNEPS